MGPAKAIERIRTSVIAMTKDLSTALRVSRRSRPRMENIFCFCVKLCQIVSLAEKTPFPRVDSHRVDPGQISPYSHAVETKAHFWRKCSRAPGPTVFVEG